MNITNYSKRYFRKLLSLPVKKIPFRRMIKSRFLLGSLYLSAIPVFALFYAFAIPNDFYHSTLLLEKNSIRLHDNLKLQLAGDIARHVVSLKTRENDPILDVSYEQGLLRESLKLGAQNSSAFHLLVEHNKVEILNPELLADKDRYLAVERFKIENIVIDKEDDDIYFDLWAPDFLFLDKDTSKENLEERLHDYRWGVGYSDSGRSAGMRIRCYFTAGGMGCLNRDTYPWLYGYAHSDGFQPWRTHNTRYDPHLTDYTKSLLRQYELMSENVNMDYGGAFQRMLYFSAVTITTLGFGDIAPLTNRARMLVAFESIFGIIIIGLFVSSLARP